MVAGEALDLGQAEVLVIEPFYDSYSPVVAMAGCHRVAVPMVRDGRGFVDSTSFCAELPERAGVAAIPMSAFCDPAAAHADEWKHLVRFAFCKRDETMNEAIRRLQVLRDHSSWSSSHATVT